MARMARLVQRGFPYHVTHRGDRRADVFRCDSDRNRYPGLLRTYAERYGLDLWAYCLKSNHVHLLVRPQCEDSMALAIGTAHRAYSRLMNEQHEWTGHLWAGRFTPVGVGGAVERRRSSRTPQRSTARGRPRPLPRVPRRGGLR